MPDIATSAADLSRFGSTGVAPVVMVVAVDGHYRQTKTSKIHDYTSRAHTQSRFMIVGFEFLVSKQIHVTNDVVLMTWC
jgi:hypothetical protein